MGDVYFIIVPIIIVVVVLKISLICCRIWMYQKRREQQVQIVHQRRMAQSRCATARVVSVRQIQGPGGMAQQTAYAIDQPGCPTQHVTRTVIVRPASGRPNNPNLPPSYDQAVTGADRSVKVDDGDQTTNNPHVNEGSNPPHPPPSSLADITLPHMPPPRNPPSAPPAYQPAPSAPSPDIPYSDQQRLLA